MITNRKPKDRKGTRNLYSDDKFNDGTRGPNEFECVEVDTGGRRWSHDFMGSISAFAGVKGRMALEKRDCVFLLHGFNNTFEDAVEAGEAIGRENGVVPVVLSWPAAVTGLPFEDYREKKRFAVRSSAFVDRVLEMFIGYLRQVPRKQTCGQNIHLITHSMGGYILKALFTQGHYQGETRIFHNIIICAGDINAEGSGDFIRRLECTGEIFVTVNTGDGALRVSQGKLGEAQKKRRGSTLEHICQEKGVFVDFSGALGRDHSYFKKSGNRKVRAFFKDVFNSKDPRPRLRVLIPEKLYSV